MQVTPPSIESGCRVAVAGLTGRTDLNGRVGVALDFDAAVGRWAVQVAGFGMAKRKRRRF